MRIDIKLSQQDLGNLMGTTRESVNKQMRTWIDSGIVSIDHGIITILDQNRLALFCDPF